MFPRVPHRGRTDSDRAIKCLAAGLYSWNVVEGWESGPFEGPPTLKPPALPGDIY